MMWGTLLCNPLYTIPKQLRGFTLIELLIVLTIMMTLLGLVGGSVIDSVQRTRAQAEVVSFLNCSKSAGLPLSHPDNRCRWR